MFRYIWVAALCALTLNVSAIYGQNGQTVVDSNSITKAKGNQPFIRGNGIMSAGGVDVPRFSLTPLFSIPGQLEILGACSTIQSDLLINVLDGSWAAFFETGKVKIFHRSLTTNHSIGNTDSTNGERFFLQLTKDGGPTVTMDGSAAFGNPCFVQWEVSVINRKE